MDQEASFDEIQDARNYLYEVSDDLKQTVLALEFGFGKMGLPPAATNSKAASAAAAAVVVVIIVVVVVTSSPVERLNLHEPTRLVAHSTISTTTQWLGSMGGGRGSKWGDLTRLVRHFQTPLRACTSNPPTLPIPHLHPPHPPKLYKCDEPSQEALEVAFDTYPLHAAAAQAPVSTFRRALLRFPPLSAQSSCFPSHPHTWPHPPHPPKLYKWDEPSREAIEAAFDTLLQTHYKQRRKLGFQPSGVHGRSAPRAVQAPTVVDRVKALFDPTVTMRTIINEGAVFGAFALW